MGVNLFGTDLGGAFDAIKGATADLFQHLDSGGSGAPFQRLQGGGGDQFQALGQSGDPFQGLSYGGDQFGKLGGSGDPFAALGYGSTSSPFGAFEAASQRVKTRAQQAEAAAAAGQPQTTGSVVGNATYTGLPADVAKWADQANQTFGDQGGWVPAAMLAIIQHESGGSPSAYNGAAAGGAWGLFQQMGLGSNDPNTQFAAAKKLLQDKLKMINASYQRLGLNPDDRTRARDLFLAWAGQFDPNTAGPSSARDVGNGQDANTFLNGPQGIMPMYDNVVRGRQQASAPGGRYQGVGGLPSLTGGIGAIGQEFGDTDFSAGNPIYDYGRGSGVSGHTGIDWAVPAGTQVYMPAGLTGTVITSGGTAYFRDEDENPSAVSPQGQGELKIHLSNGMDLILGHMRNISVPVGTQLTAGQAVGLAGSANGGHIHVELRVADPSLPNGYRIIDPRTILGQPTGGGGAGYR